MEESTDARGNLRPFANIDESMSGVRTASDEDDFPAFAITDLRSLYHRLQLALEQHIKTVCSGIKDLISASDVVGAKAMIQDVKIILQRL